MQCFVRSRPLSPYTPLSLISPWYLPDISPYLPTLPTLRPSHLHWSERKGRHPRKISVFQDISLANANEENTNSWQRGGGGSPWDSWDTTAAHQATPCWAPNVTARSCCCTLQDRGPDQWVPPELEEAATLPYPPPPQLLSLGNPQKTRAATTTSSLEQ